MLDAATIQKIQKHYEKINTFDYIKLKHSQIARDRIFIVFKKI